MFNPNLMIKNIVTQSSVHAFILLLGRALLAYLFIIAGWGKIASYTATVGYMESKGVPGALLPLTILAEFGGGLALLFGFQTRLTALVLAVLSVITAMIFHTGTDKAQVINFMKNISIAGGFLILMLHGAGHLSIDALIEKDSS